MTYAIELVHESGQVEFIAEATGVVDATRAANRAASRFAGRDGLVYVTWFRESDGQRGYWNPDGRHDVIGKAW